MPVASSERRLKVLILSEVRILGEGLARALGCNDILSISDPCGDLDDALAKIPDLQPDIILLDASLSGGSDSVGLILGVAPQAKVVVFAVAETPTNIVAWAEAGVAGYIPRTTTLDDVAPLLVAIMRDEQPCSARVAAGMLRRLCRTGNSNRDRRDARSLPTLTVRETQVIELICAGLSNKDIARRLRIGLGTTKSHVHNLLGKLNMQRRTQAVFWMREHQGRPSTSWSKAPPAGDRSGV